MQPPAAAAVAAPAIDKGGVQAAGPLRSRGAQSRAWPPGSSRALPRWGVLFLAACASAGLRWQRRLFAGAPTRGLARRAFAQARGAVEKCEGEAFINDAIVGSKWKPSVLVLSFSTTSCGPCRVMDPKVDELSERFAHGARFIKIVGDGDPDGDAIMKKFAVRNVPQYHVYKKSKRVAAIRGTLYADLLAALEAHVDPDT